MPFFTIIIPTRNRADTLFYSIKTILNQSFKDFELIISDNSTNEESQKLINTILDSRVVNLKTDGNLCMSDNWEYALKNANGKYVLIIGDDDGLVIDALQFCYDKISSLKPDAFMFDWIGYNWPINNNSKIVPSQISIPLNLKEEYIINSDLIFKKIMNSKDTYNSLPSIYTSFISKELIDEISIQSGRFFNSVIPDVFSGMQIVKKSKNIYKTTRLIGIRGASTKSNGVVFISDSKNSLKLQDEFNDLNSKSNIKWNSLAPYVFCYYAYSLESFFQICEINKIKITNYQFTKYYLKLIRRIYFDYINNFEKVRKELYIIENVIKNNYHLNWSMKFLLLSYIYILLKNEKRNYIQDASESLKSGITDNQIIINGNNFGINNIEDLQLFLVKLLNY